jgi:hypothetical protein
VGEHAKCNRFDRLGIPSITISLKVYILLHPRLFFLDNILNSARPEKDETTEDSEDFALFHVSCSRAKDGDD